MQEDNVATVKDNLPSKFYSALSDGRLLDKIDLPVGISLSYGCGNCEWKAMNLCPHGFNGYGNEGVHEDFICPERVAYLKGFYRGEKPNPTFTEWEADYSQGVAMKVFQNEMSTIKGLDERIRLNESELKKISVDDPDGDSASYKKFFKENHALIKMRAQSFDRWMQLWKNIRGFQENRLNREAPKKLEVTHRNTVSVDEFNRMINRTEKVIDADFDVLEGDEL